jgi:septal ring factor EnvC (AmiA/AmiB activator)
MNDIKKYERLKSNIEKAKTDIAEATFAIKHAEGKLKEYGAETVESAQKILEDLISEREEQQQQLEDKLDEFTKKYAEVLED